MAAGRLAFAAAAAACLAAGGLAWHSLATPPGRDPLPRTDSRRDAASPADREADDIRDAVRRGRLGAALAGVVSFLRRFDPAALDESRRGPFEASRLEAGRWGLAESEALAGRGDRDAAEAILQRACAVLAGTEAEAEAAAVARRVRERVEALVAAESAAAARAALGPAEAAVAAARAKASSGKAAEGLADLLVVLQATEHPAARARVEKEVSALRRDVKASEARAALRKRADEAIAKGSYARARDILKGMVEGAGTDVPAAEAAKDREKLEGVKELEENREPEALAALRTALRWMAKQQLADGSFTVALKGDDGKEVPEETRKKAPYRIGITGLAALALLGHVRHDLTDEFEPSLDRSLASILAAQKKDGSFSSFLYEHAICTLALVEADRLLRKEGMKGPAQAGLAWLQDAQNADGGWKYQPRGPVSDVSVTGWALQALLHGERGGYELKPETVDRAFGYLDRMTDPVTKRTAYQVPGGGGTSMTAVALFCRLRDSRGLDDDSVRIAAEYLAKNPPGSAGMKGSSYAVFYASDAMSRLGGDWWRKWAPALKKSLLDSQVKEGDAEGSWPAAEDPWAQRAGPVYHAAMNALSLENFFEHRP